MPNITGLVGKLDEVDATCCDCIELGLHEDGDRVIDAQYISLQSSISRYLRTTSLKL